MNIINTETAINLINDAKKSGQYFSVVACKKNGMLREFKQCKGHVKDDLKGGVLKYSPENKGLICIHEKNEGFKMINIQGIRQVICFGTVFNVNNE